MSCLQNEILLERYYEEFLEETLKERDGAMERFTKQLNERGSK